MNETLKGHWDIPGLPDRWPELLADALSELGDEEFEQAWQVIGKDVRARSRAIRAGIEAINSSAP